MIGSRSEKRHHLAFQECIFILQRIIPHVRENELVCEMVVRIIQCISCKFEKSETGFKINSKPCAY